MPGTLHCAGGAFGSVRLRMGVEEHGAGKQLVRLRAVPIFPGLGLGILGILLAMGSIDLLDRGWLTALPVVVPAALIAVRMLWDAGAAMAVVRNAVALTRPGETLIRGRK